MTEHVEQPLPLHCPGVIGAHDLMIKDITLVSTHVADDNLWAATIVRIEKRKQIGFDRYGQLLCPDDGRDTLRDAMEEALDLCAYMRNLLRLGHDLRRAYDAAFGVLLDLVCEQEGLPKIENWPGFFLLASG